MATYSEIYDLRNDPASLDLRRRVSVAMSIKSQAILDDGASTSLAKTWATETLQTPEARLDSIFNYVLAANKDATTGQITGATDTQIQSNVDTAIDAITGAL